MKFNIEVDFPLEPFNTYVRQGTIGEKIGEVLGAIKPEVIYFTDSGVGRGVVMIVDLDSAAQAPHVTEPLMLLRRVGALPGRDVAGGTPVRWPGQVRHGLTGATARRDR